MILADTSAWVEFDRATGSAVDQRLTELISEDGPLAVTEPIVMEVLARAHHGPREDDLRRLMLRFDLLPRRPLATLSPAPTEESNQTSQPVDALLGGGVGPIEGRPPGPLWAHQGYRRFPPSVADEPGLTTSNR